jgi:hypothetical protein
MDLGRAQGLPVILKRYAYRACTIPDSDPQKNARVLTLTTSYTPLDDSPPLCRI